MNLKKIAASIAALGAVTFAHAANVEFYGSIDNSVSYIKAKGQNGQASTHPTTAPPNSASPARKTSATVISSASSLKTATLPILAN